MYNTPYFNNFNQQQNLDRINNQIQELEKMKAQMQQPQQMPTNLTQNFQIAPTNREVIKYANDIGEVQRDMVVGDTPYFSKDMSVVWVKNTKGEIKSYELNEIVEKDAKDLKIEALLQSNDALLQNNNTLIQQLEDLKKELKKNEQSISTNDVDEFKGSKSTKGKMGSRPNAK